MSGRRLYFDTNVFIYAMETPGGFGELARNCFSRLDSGLLSAVTREITLAELLRGAGRPGFELYESYLRLFDENMGVETVPVTRATLIEAAGLDVDRKLALVDAIHIATARLSGCDAILTEDARMPVPADIPKVRLAEALRIS